MPDTIVLVEDEPRMARFLDALLSGHEFAVVHARTGGQGVVDVAQHNPVLVLLDLGLPDVDGLEVITRLRSWTDVPIVVLSARGAEQDKVRALDLGADDYLTKPFGAEELLARVRVALRHRARRQHEPESVIEVGDLRIDLPAHRVWRGEAPVVLTPTEFRLLVMLARNAGRVLTPSQILQEVWGQAFVRHTHYVRVHVSQLRRKIEPDPSRPTYILTETGVGYRFREP
jgi:two-component system KDP operon response regulator KdpE